MATILTVCRKSHHTFATLNKAKDMSTWFRDHSDARNILSVPQREKETTAACVRIERYGRVFKHP